MILPQFTAPGYMDRTLNEVQRCVNLYPEKTPSGYKLISSPGLNLSWTTANNLPCRGRHYSSTGKLFSCHGAVVYETTTGGGPSSRGSVVGTAGPVYMADNGTQLFIVEASTGACYTLTMASGSVTSVADSDCPAASMVTYQDGYFILSKLNSHQIYISARGDGTDWDALDFTSAEAKGDYLAGVFSNGTTLYAVGTKSTQLFYNTQNPSFPFEPITGATYQFGTPNAATMANINGNLYFLGSSEGGKGTVWEFAGNTPRKVSTPYLEKIFGEFNLTGVFGYCYHLDGHSFYHLTSGVDNKTFVYDIGEGVWHERDSDVSSSYVDFRLSHAVNAFDSATYGNPVGFDQFNGKIYNIGGTFGAPINSEDGTSIRRRRIFGPIEADGKIVFHDRLRLVMESANDIASAYSVSADLRWSDDDGLTWSSVATRSRTTTATQTSQRTVLDWNRLGSSRRRFYELTMTGPNARMVLQSAELDSRLGTH